MANAYSTPINYGQTIPTTDLAQYAGAIQRGMQQKFDINLAKIDDLISKVATVPLARDKDKKYLGEKLQGLLSMVDANSKVDLSDNVVARQISSYVASAIDSNVREQLANSQKISSYQQTAAQRKKDKPELYNDANYAYGLDKSGYAAYMKGDTDSLGSMQYIDYHDIDTNLNKKLENFAKERGFEKVMDSSVEGGYIYKTVKGKELTQDEVSNFFNTTVASDPKLKQQFMINAHYNYRGLSDDAIIKDYKEKADPIFKEFDTKIGDIEGRLKNVNPDDKATADLLHRQKSELQKQKDDFNSQLDPKNFNRDSFLYNQYTNSLKSSYMKTYAYSAVTDIKYDDFLLDIAKAKGELSADGTPTGTGTDASGLPGGTLFQRDMVATNKDEQPDYMTDFNNQRTGSWKELQGVIKSQLIKDGKGTTAADITNYYLGLKKASKEGIDLNAQGYNSELLSAYGKVENLNKTAYQLTKVAKENYGKSTNDILTGLFGGKSKDLSVEGLATTAPVTAGLLKKYKSASQIPKKEKAIALYEIAKNIKENVLDEDKDKANMDFYLQALKRENNISDKELAKVKPKETGSGWSGLGNMLLGAGQSAYNTLIAPTLSSVMGLGDMTGEDLQKGTDEDAAAAARGVDKMSTGAKQFWGSLSRSFTQDADLSEIESGDIKLGKYQGVTDLITDTKASVSSRFEQILAKGKANLQKESSIVLSPANKRDKPYLDAINSAIVAQGGTPVQDGFVNIKSIKDGVATISYTSEDMVETKSGGTKKQNVPGVEIQVPVNNLPQNLIKNLQTSLSDWTYSASNPTKMEVSMAYSPPSNLESRYELAQKYVKNNSAYMSPEEIKNIQMTGFSAIKTKEELQKEADKKLPREYASDFSSKYLNSKYSVKWERPEGGGGFVGYLVKDGTKVEQVPPLGTDYNPHVYSLYTMKVINQYLENQITEYRRNAMYSNN
jgi:hypothetical protein